jgi:hypothetical protein
LSHRIIRIVAGLVLAVGFGTTTFAQGQPAAPAAEPKTPVLRIPKLSKAPVIDGKIDPKEWQGATAVTAFPNLNGEMSLPQFLQPVWYLAYDDQNLYLAFHYPVYPKGSLRAACKTKAMAEGSQAILWDDHTEIEICDTARERAVSGYFFKFMTNPWDVVSDQKVRWSIGQQGYEYDTGTVVKSTFTDDYWDQEIAIPIKDLGVNQIKDGDKWFMQIVSAQDSGGNYWTWTPATWLAFHKFPEVIFDSKAAAVQFTGVGDWMNGNPDFTFQMFNPQQKDIDVNVGVKIIGSDGKVLLDQTKPVALKPGESHEEHVKAAGLALGPIIAGKDNRVYLNVTDAHTGAVYYENNMALRNGNSADVKGYIDNFKVARKPLGAKLQFAYMPSFNKLNVTTDIGILGIDPKLAKEAKYLSASFSTQDGKPVAKNSVPMNADGTGKLEFSFPTLADGTYDISMEIDDANGKPLVSKKDTFLQKQFPFQSFKMGLDETVIKPYTPIEAKGHSFDTVGNHVQITDTGLVAAIDSKLIPKEASRNIMAGPMDLVVTENGRAMKLTAANQDFAWAPSNIPTKVTGTAESHIGDLTFKMTGHADYTGQYLVDVDIIPNGKVAVDRLELEVPVTDPVDTCFSYTERDSSVLYTKAHPWKGEPKEGVVWDNLSNRSANPYIMYVGDGERGLYWYTDSFEGFWLDHNKPYVFVEKRKADTVLRVAVFNKPVVIDHPRHLHFAVMGVPTKPLPSDARQMQWSGARMHIGGASWWGTIGCFVFPLNDQEWQNWIAGKPFTWNGKQYPGQCALLPAPPMSADGRWLLQKGHEYGSYRAADIIGYLQPELKVFAGEWIGVTNPPMSPDASLLGYQDANHKSVWPEPEQRSIYGKDACIKSFYDFESYYFYLMAKNTGAGGYWWDWGSMVAGHSMDKGEMYLNDEGQPEPRLNLFMVRDFYQRIARIVQELGIPDTNNCYAPGAVYQMPWLTRINAWESLYLESDLDDMFDAWGVDRYRMQIGKFSGIPVQNVMNVPVDFTNPRARTIIALALLHDNGVCGADGNKPGMDMLKKAGILDESADWIPYWRSQSTAQADQPGLLITAYRYDANKKLTLVIVNPGPSDIQSDIQVPGSPAGQAIDDETGKTISGNGRQIRGITVKRHDFRLLTIE